MNTENSQDSSRMEGEWVGGEIVVILLYHPNQLMNNKTFICTHEFQMHTL